MKEGEIYTFKTDTPLGKMQAAERKKLWGYKPCFHNGVG